MKNKRIQKITGLIITLLLVSNILSTNVAQAYSTTDVKDAQVEEVENTDEGLKTDEDKRDDEFALEEDNKDKGSKDEEIELTDKKAEPTQEETIESEEKEFVNPLYKDYQISIEEKESQNINVTEPKQTFYSKEQAINYVKQKMLKRESNFSFTLNNVEYYSKIWEDIILGAFYDNGNCKSSEGDYLLWHFSSARGKQEGTTRSFTLTYSDIKYHSTYAQEQKVDAEVKKVLNKLNVYNSDEYTKIKAVHDYIISNI